MANNGTLTVYQSASASSKKVGELMLYDTSHHHKRDDKTKNSRLRGMIFPGGRDFDSMKSKILKISVIILLAVVVSSCTNNNITKEKTIIVKPLPKKCGKYDIVYGKVDSHGVFRTMDGTVVNLLSGLDTKGYRGMRLLLCGEYWYQRGGLLKPDGSDASFSVDNLLQASVLQVVDDGFDYELIEKKCNGLEEEQ